MRAAVIDAPHSVRVVDVDDPCLADDSVLAAVSYVGLCGTDLEFLHGTSPYLIDGRAAYPHSFGHEWVGVVQQVGRAVSDISPGDVVTGSTMVFCQQCTACSGGTRNLCTRLNEVGLYGHPGAAAELLVMPSRAVVSFGAVEPSPAHVLVEPMVTVLEALRHASIRPGDRVLVVGAGTIGSLTLALLAGSGAMVDVVDPRPVAHLDPAWFRRLSCDFAGLHGNYDVVVEASGAPGALTGGIARLRSGGTCLLVGVGVSPEPVDPGLVALAGIRILGVRHGIDHYPRAVALYPALAPMLERLVDDVFPLDQIDGAFQRLASARKRPKVVVSVE